MIFSTSAGRFYEGTKFWGWQEPQARLLGSSTPSLSPSPSSDGWSQLCAQEPLVW